MPTQILCPLALRLVLEIKPLQRALGNAGNVGDVRLNGLGKGEDGSEGKVKAGTWVIGEGKGRGEGSR